MTVVSNNVGVQNQGVKLNGGFAVNFNAEIR